MSGNLRFNIQKGRRGWEEGDCHGTCLFQEAVNWEDDWGHFGDWNAVCWCRYLYPWRGSCPLPHPGPTHWLILGGQVGPDNVSGRGCPHLSVSWCTEYCVYAAFSLTSFWHPEASDGFLALRSASFHRTCHFIKKESLSRIASWFLFWKVHPW